MAQKKQGKSEKSLPAYKVADDEEIERFLEDPESFEPNSSATAFYRSLRYGDSEVVVEKTKKKS